MKTEQSTLPQMAEQDDAFTPGYGHAFPLEYADMVCAQVRAALQALPTCEREAVTLCFGIDCYAEGSYREIGRAMGISRKQARRLIASALRKLRHEPALQMLAVSVPALWDWYGDPDSYGVA